MTSHCHLSLLSPSKLPLDFRNQGKKSAHFLYLLSQEAWRLPHVLLLTITTGWGRGWRGRGGGGERPEPILQIRSEANSRRRAEERRARWDPGLEGAKAKAGQREHPAHLQPAETCRITCIWSAPFLHSPPQPQLPDPLPLSSEPIRNLEGSGRLPNLAQPATQAAGTEPPVWPPRLRLCVHSPGYTRPVVCVSGSVKLRTNTQEKSCGNGGRVARRAGRGRRRELGKTGFLL